MDRLSAGSTCRFARLHVLSKKAAAAWALSAPLACLLLCVSVLTGCVSPPQKPVESSRLHVIAVLYGKYLAVHSGEMPADAKEFAEYIDMNERDILLRHGCKSAQE